MERKTFKILFYTIFSTWSWVVYIEIFQKTIFLGFIYTFAIDKNKNYELFRF